jgi:hypothetical protein
MERLARNEFLGNLPFEFNAMGTILGHGFHPLKAWRSRSIPNLQDVHRQGRTRWVSFKPALTAAIGPCLGATLPSQSHIMDTLIPFSAAPAVAVERNCPWKRLSRARNPGPPANAPGPI